MILVYILKTMGNIQKRLFLKLSSVSDYQLIGIFVHGDLNHFLQLLKYYIYVLKYNKTTITCINNIPRKYELYWRFMIIQIQSTILISNKV